MALRDQPYLPLYVQDFLTDEKLRECKPDSVGVYAFIMCVMHKSDEYGKILLKQKNKQNESIKLDFAVKLAKHLPYSIDVIHQALIDLIDEKVLHIENNALCQKRMIKDNELSIKRSLAGKKGGLRTQQKDNFAQAKQEASSENENEDENTKSDTTSNTDIQEALQDVLEYFKLNELKSGQIFFEATKFVSGLKAAGRLSIFKTQFAAYKEYINANPKYKHDFLNFIYKWDKVNYVMKLQDYKKTLTNGKNSSNNKQGNRISQGTEQIGELLNKGLEAAANNKPVIDISDLNAFD